MDISGGNKNMKKRKKPWAVFEVLFDGPQMLPETIPLGTLTQALSAIRRLATGTESQEDDDESSDTEEAGGAIRLLDVVRGSGVYRFVCPETDQAVDRLRLAGRALANPEEFGEKDYILNPIERLSITARRMGCRIILREANKEDGILATIEPESYERISDKLFITGDTSFMGTVERVGGATSMRCALRVAFQQRLLFC